MDMIYLNLKKPPLMYEMRSILVASFDMGQRNFAFCIERIPLDGWESIPHIPKRHRYLKNGQCTPPFASVLDTVTSKGQLVYWKHVDLTSIGSTPEQVLFKCTSVLDDHLSWWQQSSAFIIEQQMSFGSVRNPMAVRLAHHCLSYFQILFGSFKVVVDFPSYHKTRVLGAQKKQSKRERKQWSVTYTKSLLHQRQEWEWLEYLNQHKKQDDLADVVTQLQAFKFLTFVDHMRG
jgi:hypothetical protein